MLYCELVEEDIEEIDCIVVCDVVMDMLKETAIDERFFKKENYKDICRRCKYHDYIGE